LQFCQLYNFQVPFCIIANSREPFRVLPGIALGPLSRRRKDKWGNFNRTSLVCPLGVEPKDTGAAAFKTNSKTTPELEKFRVLNHHDP
jgi:hypothetical protein